METPSAPSPHLTLPYLAYALTVLSAGFHENALRRAPASYVALAQELGLRNAGTNQDMLNRNQAKELADRVKALTGEEREQALAYAALSALQISNEELSELPPLSIFEVLTKSRTITQDEIRKMEQLIAETINSFVAAEVRHEYTMVGPRVIRFGILPTGKPVLVGDAPKRGQDGRVVYASRTKIDDITKREKDLQAALGVKTIHLLPPVPGEHHVGLEVPNPYPALVSLREMIESRDYQHARRASKLVFALGPDVAGRIHFCDIAKAPHLLIAGATGAGKSMLLNVLLASILTQATSDDVRLLMIDPKLVELTPYNGIPHLLQPVVTEVTESVPLLDRAIAEMERRYQIFSQLGVRNLDSYRKLRMDRIAQGDTTLENLPAIVIIIDELADLMMTAPKEIEAMICRLAQKARAIGIHLVIATQRPSVDVITGLIKANIPARIAFMVSSVVDSRIILDAGGAEHLLGRGDMLYLPSDASNPTRIQGAFMADQDAQNLADYWRKAEVSTQVAWVNEESNQQIEKEPEDGDELLITKIIAEVIPVRQILSASFIQKQYRIGFQRAARIIERLEQRGYVSAPEGGRNERRVLNPEVVKT